MAAKDSTIFVVGVDSVEAVRNHQKVADLRPWGGATTPTAIAATGSLVAIGFGVSPCMPGVRALLTSSPSIFFFFVLSVLWVPSWYIGSEGSAVRLGWQDAPGGWPAGRQQRPRERSRVLPRWLEARCRRRKLALFLPSPSFDNPTAHTARNTTTTTTTPSHVFLLFSSSSSLPSRPRRFPLVFIQPC